MIYEAADHRNEADVTATWNNYFDAVHTSIADNPNATEQPYEAIITMVRDMANRLNMSEATFSPTVIIPLVERYAVQCQNGVGPRTWVIDLFIHVKFQYETILSILQGMLYNDQEPFTGRNKRILADHILYVSEQWYSDCMRNNERLYGGEENAEEVSHLLQTLITGGLGPAEVEAATELRRKIERSFR